ncbi:MAG: TIGR00730 family Rossman fold protein [Deltaproteobacteria bacterium CG11_big_fil_rev_8_21_14_0_20_47_16]|nr:MAG: TIGR00730 family Rossman fold protein [Deltaproteobacteria bacterium CG11_big_fil_rev_8_21_14_0_20_47_16]
MKRIAVFCGAYEGNDPRFVAAARTLGQILVSRDIGLVYGGGSTGIMGAIANEVLKNGGKVTGVIPEKLFKREVAHRGVTEFIPTTSMHERKSIIYNMSDAFIGLPGGLGTMDEMFEVLTWAQLGLHQKPYGFLNVAGYFDHILKFVDHAVDCGFVFPNCRDMIMRDATPEGLLKQFATYQPVQLPHLIDEADL